MIKRVVVNASFANTYDTQKAIQVRASWRVKKGFTFETSYEDDKRYLIELSDDPKFIGRWIHKELCRVIEEHEDQEDEPEIDVSTVPYDGEVCDMEFRVLGPVRLAKSLRQRAEPCDEFGIDSIITTKFKTVIIVDGMPSPRFLIHDSDLSKYKNYWIEFDKNIKLEYDSSQYTETIEDPEDKVEISLFKGELYTLPDPPKGKSWVSMTDDEIDKYLRTIPMFNTPTVRAEINMVRSRGFVSVGGNSGTSAKKTTGTKGTVDYYNRLNTGENLVTHNGSVNLSATLKPNLPEKKRYLCYTVDGHLKHYLMQYGEGDNKTMQEVVINSDSGKVVERKQVENTATMASIREAAGMAKDYKGVDWEQGVIAKSDEAGVNLTDEANTEKYKEFEREYLEEFGDGRDYDVDQKDVNLYTESGLKDLYSIYGLTYNSDTSYMGVPLERMNFVHGLPFQFSPIADRRRGAITSETSGKTDMYGMIFAREILAQVPIAVFAPGKPQFLAKLKSGFWGSITGKGKDANIKDMWMPLISGGSGTVENALDKLMLEGGDYDYYSIRIDTADYYNFVNMICKTSARNMGLKDPLQQLPKGNRVPMHLDWSKYNIDIDVNCSNDSLMSVLGMNSGVAFAFDAQSSITDSISNSTTESKMAGIFNQMSATSRELGFVMGYATKGEMGNNWGQVKESEFAEAAVEYNKGLMNGALPLIDSIAQYCNNIGQGMNVRFPEIWNDSTQTKSYSLDMHFISPYANKLSIWRHVLVPFWHIFCLAAPQSINRINVYNSPFLIRAFSKGYFNVEMGMIESISYKRFGDGNMITANGIPRQIDVTVDFKDLYHALAITPYHVTNMGLFFNNTGLLDLIGTLSGVNMNRLGLGERFSLYVYAGETRVRSLGSSFMNHVRDRARGIIDKIYFGV